MRVTSFVYFKFLVLKPVAHDMLDCALVYSVIVTSTGNFTDIFSQSKVCWQARKGVGIENKGRNVIIMLEIN